MNTYKKTKNGNVQFSVIIPVYNVETFLNESIQSVLKQSLKSFEMILVDDGSSDSSGVICDDYAKKYSFVKVIHTENFGQLHARKCGIDEAIGNYCVFLDADDYLEPNCLEIIYKAIKKNVCDCVIFGMARVIDGRRFSIIADDNNFVLTDKRELYKKCLLSVDYNSVCRKAVKTTILKNINYDNYYNIRHGEDLIQSLDVFKNSNCVCVIKDILYNYRLNLQSVTQNVTYSNFQIENTVREKVLDFLRNENVFTTEDYDEYREYCVFLIVKKITQIALFNINFKQKKQLYDRIRDTKYYVHFVSQRTNTKKKINKCSILFYLYKKKMYFLLTVIIKIVKGINK